MSGPTDSGAFGAVDDREVMEGIREVARRHLRWSGSLRGDESLVDALRLDSIRMLTLVVELENHFRICLDEDSPEGIETLDDLVLAIRSKLDERTADPE